MILNVHEYKQVWCYQTDFRPVRKELEGEKTNLERRQKREKGPDGSGRRKGDEGKSMGAGGGGGGKEKMD